jgi:hypothetical protein
MARLGSFWMEWLELAAQEREKKGAMLLPMPSSWAVLGS